MAKTIRAERTHYNEDYIGFVADVKGEVIAQKVTNILNSKKYRKETNSCCVFYENQVRDLLGLNHRYDPMEDDD